MYRPWRNDVITELLSDDQFDDPIPIEVRQKYENLFKKLEQHEKSF